MLYDQSVSSLKLCLSFFDLLPFFLPATQQNAGSSKFIDNMAIVIEKTKTPTLSPYFYDEYPVHIINKVKYNVIVSTCWDVKK